MAWKKDDAMSGMFEMVPIGMIGGQRIVPQPRVAEQFAPPIKEEEIKPCFSDEDDEELRRTRFERISRRDELNQAKRFRRVGHGDFIEELDEVDALIESLSGG